MSQHKLKHSKNKLTPMNNRGQLVVEYVILLVIVVALALLITNTAVSRSPDNPGFLVAKWRQIIELISNDNPDSI